MDVKDWLVLKILDEERNITKASFRLYTSQPAVTYRLKKLEEELGAELLIRLPKETPNKPLKNLVARKD